MGFKDFFYKASTEEEEMKPVEGKSVTPRTPASVTQLPTNQVNVPIGAPVPEGEFNEYFQKIMEDSNLPGPDYYEFIKALDGFKGGLPEEQKYQAIFAGFSVQGVTPDKLIESATEYLSILEQRKISDFDASVQEGHSRLVGLTNQIDVFAKENIELSNRIAANNEKIASMNAEIETKKSKLSAKTAGFKSSYDSFTNKIKTNIENIKKYLNASTNG